MPSSLNWYSLVGDTVTPGQTTAYHLASINQSARGRCAGETTAADPDAVAQSYWHVHAQDKSAWTQEMDIRSPSLM